MLPSEAVASCIVTLPSSIAGFCVILSLYFIYLFFLSLYYNLVVTMTLQIGRVPIISSCQTLNVSNHLTKRCFQSPA